MLIFLAWLAGTVVVTGIYAYRFRGDMDEYVRSLNASPSIFFTTLFWPAVLVWHVVLTGPFKLAWFIGSKLAHRKTVRTLEREASTHRSLDP